MTEPIAYSVFGVLALVAAVHYFWATGSTWPVATRDEFVRTFVGLDESKSMPGKVLTMLVATLILLAGALALWGTGLINLPLPDWSKPHLLWAMFAVFLARGLLTYVLPKLPRAEPFKTLDRRYYAPLCLALPAGYLCLALNI